MTRAPLDQRLATAGDERHAAEADCIRAAKHLHRVVREADRTAGWTKTRIAKVAGISRQTVHNILKENR